MEIQYKDLSGWMKTAVVCVWVIVGCTILDLLFIMTGVY